MQPWFDELGLRAEDVPCLICQAFLNHMEAACLFRASRRAVLKLHMPHKQPPRELLSERIMKRRDGRGGGARKGFGSGGLRL